MNSPYFEVLVIWKLIHFFQNPFHRQLFYLSLRVPWNTMRRAYCDIPSHKDFTKKFSEADPDWLATAESDLFVTEFNLHIIGNGWTQTSETWKMTWTWKQYTVCGVNCHLTRNQILNSLFVFVAESLTGWSFLKNQINNIIILERHYQRNSRIRQVLRSSWRLRTFITSLVIINDIMSH